MMNLRTVLLEVAIERMVSLAALEENDTFRAIYMNALRKLDRELRAGACAVRQRAALN